MTEVQERLAQLSPQRQALLAELVAKASGRDTITRREEGVDVPASFAQARLWLVDQLEKDKPTYNVPIPIRFRGDLDASALAASLTDLVARHETLRTTFRAGEDGQPLQVIRPAAPFPLPVVDLSNLRGEDWENAIQQLVYEEENTPYDLIAGPLVRARLLRGADEHVLLFGVHHIAFDSWSLPIFYRELADGYNSRVTGTTYEPADLDIQYADFSVWQRDDISGDKLSKLVDYWREQLDGLPTLDLPTDRQAPEMSSGHGGSLTTPLPQDLIEQARELGRTEGASLFMTVTAALNVLLSRYTGQDDIAIGASAAERDRPEVRDLIGFFPNAFVLRTDLSGAPTFRELLRRVRETAVPAYGHAALPFDLLVQELKPQRVGNRTPFFRVYLQVDESTGDLPSFQNVPEFAGLETEGIVPEFVTAKFELGFNLRTGAAETVVEGVYSTDILEKTTMERILGHLRTVLQSAVSEPDRPITELAVLTADERERILHSWNDTETWFPSGSGLHHLFEQRAMENGTATAVVCGTDSISYRKLDEQANQLAHFLRAQGFQRGDLAGVCLPRSVLQTVAILGVLKAGGAYLPLDPDYPADRLSFMVGDSGAWGVLTDSSFELDASNVVRLDETDFSGEPVTPLPGDFEPGQIAYVIYTSGSTGTPKGIELTHQGAVNNFTDFNTRFGIGPGDSVLGVSSASFDMSVYDLLGTLAAGSTLVLPEPAAAKEPARWAQLMRQHGITVWHSAPALLELLLDQDGGAELPRLRLALLGGDWIPLTLPDRLRAVAGEVRVVALGGATEVSMDSTLFEVGEIDPAWTSIPYGRPMANQRAYVLDRDLQPVPVGVPGELHFGGLGLARGYLNRPELTAERFVTQDFGDGPERLYKTGDLARWGADGVLELLGRIDFQVKVHGLRIELGEIESTLRRHDAVADAVVVARGERGHCTLAAFVRGSFDVSAVSTSDIRDWLTGELPAHMVPGSITFLPEFPTTPNGKVDRKALTAGAATTDVVAQDFDDELEQRIAEVWAEVLGLPGIGANADFFELGGDSFTAIKAMLAIDRTVPVVELFKARTVTALAEAIKRRADGPQRLLNELTPSDRDAVLTIVCVPYGGGNAITYQPLAETLPDYFALWAVGLPGHDPSTQGQRFLPIREAAQLLADEVEELIEGPVLVYGHCAGVGLALLLAQELEERGVDLRGLVQAASLPDPDPAYSLSREKVTPDDAVFGHLRSMGGFDGGLDWAEISDILTAVRHDMINTTTVYLDALSDPPAPLFAPLLAIFGSEDPATPDYPTKYADWGKFAETVSYEEIQGAGHYFIRDYAAELAAHISRRYPATEA